MSTTTIKRKSVKKQEIVKFKKSGPSKVRIDLFDKVKSGALYEVIAFSWPHNLRDQFYSRCDLVTCLENGTKSAMTFGKTQCFVDTRDLDESLLLHDNILSSTFTLPFRITDLEHVLLRLNGAILRRGDEPIIVINGDDDVRLPAVDDFPGVDTGLCPTISFRCLSRFYAHEVTMRKQIKGGKISVIDFKADSVIPFSAHEKRWRKTGQYAKLKGPVGYTAMHSAWHRSATVLLYDATYEMYILIGQDEGTYFGVELPEPVETVDEALESLVPEPVRESCYVRQGEWFFMQVDDADIPKLLDAAITVQYQQSNICTLPLESEDSNEHSLTCDALVVGKDGRVYAFNARVEHSQHEKVCMPAWSAVYRNRAVRSFSVEGVD